MRKKVSVKADSVLSTDAALNTDAVGVSSVTTGSGEAEGVLPCSVTYQRMLDELLGGGGGGSSPVFSCTYVKATGEVIRLSGVRAVRFEGVRREVVLVKVGGGSVGCVLRVLWCTTVVRYIYGSVVWGGYMGLCRG